MSKIKDNWLYIVIGLVVLAGAYLLTSGKIKVSDLSFISAAHAADKGGAKADPANPLDLPFKPAVSWTGCGLGAQGAGVIGELSAGGPGALAANGQAIGVHVRCLLQTGALVFGVEASHDWIYGDLHTIGVDRDLSLGGSIGVVVVPSDRVYIHGAWTRVSGSFGSEDHIDGWKAGFGNEIKLPGAMPLFLDARYTYGIYNVDKVIGSGVDATSHSVRVGLTYQFFGAR